MTPLSEYGINEFKANKAKHLVKQTLKRRNVIKRARKQNDRIAPKYK
jgi:hypothetical protein